MWRSGRPEKISRYGFQAHPELDPTGAVDVVESVQQKCALAHMERGSEPFFTPSFIGSRRRPRALALARQPVGVANVEHMPVAAAYWPSRVSASPGA